MAQMDRRVPAVYVDLEDRSYVSENAESERAAYIVVVSDRGRHNRIVEINSWDQFKLEFGEPDFERTGHAHYLAYQHLKWSHRLFVCRPTMDDADIANVAIKYNDPNGSSQLLYGTYQFTNGSNIVSTDEYGINDVEVGQYIYGVADSYLEAQKIQSITNNSATNTYEFILENNYTGATNNDYMYIYYPGSVVVSGSYNFINGSNIVQVSPFTDVDEFDLGDWIFPDPGGVIQADDYKISRQVINKNIYTGEITLDSNFEGTDTTSAIARKYIPFETVTTADVSSNSELVETDTDNLWYFYANGTGDYYNNLFLKGVRNTEYESLYVNDDGEPLYKYAFINLSLYERQIDGSAKLIGGPWVCSLIRTTADGSIVRDIVTGAQLYIEDVINTRNELISCKSALGIDVLLDTDNLELSELRRLQILSILSEGTVIRENTLGENGVYLDNGSNGSQYDSSGRLNLASNTTFRGLIAQAYEGTLTSVDGSVENMQQVIYPWYTFQYIYCGGYDPIVQNSARSLADTRDDCLVLGDTGYYSYNADSDIGYRQTSVPWNTYNAMLYTQYRKIEDVFTGKSFYITPVYHAIDRHLYCDSRYWIAEPVANIEKGAVQDKIELAYKPTLTKIGDLIDYEMNPTLVEPEGTYIITQFTTWKRLSILKRAHVVKFIHYLKQEIPKLLKDILQRKATKFWRSQSEIRLNSFMSRFLDTGAFDRYAAINKFELVVEFDDVASEIIVLLKIWPIRAIERITVRIIVN